MADWLPKGWKVVTEKGKNGSIKVKYTNKGTGQAFDTKEAMLRYVNYVTSVQPHLDGDSDFRFQKRKEKGDSDFKKCYMDDARYQYVDRPWENGNEHKLHDYIVGNIGKVKDLKESGSSSGPTTEEMTAQQPDDAPEEKMLMESAGQSSGAKLRKKKRPHKKKK